MYRPAHEDAGSLRRRRIMRIIEGSVDEIIEYQQRTGQRSGRDADEDLPDDVATGQGEVVDDPEDEEGRFAIQRLIYSRARDGRTTKRVLDYLDQAWDLDVIVEIGESERTRDGNSDYLMIRDSGPRRFGAVAYVHPASGRLELRLQPEDVADFEDPHIKRRNVREGHQYVITCHLVDDQAVDVAVELTKRALEKVRR
jgi:hypothetical protein